VGVTVATTVGATVGMGVDSKVGATVGGWDRDCLRLRLKFSFILGLQVKIINTTKQIIAILTIL
jgi:hypothetical protein